MSKMCPKQFRNLNLHRSEVIGYFAVYIIYIAYGLWILIEAPNKIRKVSLYKFPKGWPLLNTFKDDTSDELYVLTEYMKIYWPWYILHLAVSTVVRKYKRKAQSLANAIVCVLILLCTMQLISVALIGCLVMSYYFVACVQSKLLTWLLSFIWIITTILLKSNTYLQDNLDYIEFHNMIVTLCWSILRGCSYSLQCEKSYRMHETNLNSKYGLSHFLGYSLYFPCLILGPFMGYHRYITLRNENRTTGMHMVKSFVWQIARSIFWWVILELATHFIYVHYMAVDIKAVEILDTKFGLYAVGYFMGQFFFMFYVISYGLGIAFAQYDGLQPPRKPRCIGCVHYYSDMWKYFDEGLYEFLFTHIYAEICSKTSSALRKIVATAFTFLFVFLWHGFYAYVLIWSILNFCCLVSEKILKDLIKSPYYIGFMKNSLKLSDAGIQRFNALLGSQIFIPAAFSNCYFISGLDVGNFLMEGVYKGGWWNYLTLTFCTYCFFQCCEILQTNFLN